MKVLVLTSFMATAGKSWADPLTGDVAATHDTAAAASENPANAAFLDRSQISVAPELFRSESLQIRYPNFETVSQNESGLGSLLSLGKPGFIYKPSSRLGVGGYFIPPVGLSTDIHKKKIPVVILNNLDYVDLDAVGTLNGAAALTAGYRFGDSFGLGVNVVYQSISYEAELTPSSNPGGDPLATVSGSMTNTDVGLGVRYDPTPGRLAFGVAMGVASISSQTVSIESSLLDTAGGEGGESAGSDGSDTQSVLPLSAILAGVKYSTPKFRLLVDVKYTRVDKTQRSFSTVELKEKPKDLYDTLAVRAGMIMQLGAGNKAMAGFRYEPASLGPGSKSSETEEGAIGFGTQELVMVFAGFETLVPYWQLGLGAEWALAKQKVRGKDFAPWTVATGLVYRRASLGIDEDGEQPGAYLHQKTFVPLTITYKL